MIQFGLSSLTPAPTPTTPCATRGPAPGATGPTPPLEVDGTGGTDITPAPGTVAARDLTLRDYLATLTPNADTVEGGCYATIVEGNGDVALPGRFFVNLYNTSRIRQDGAVTHVRLFVAAGDAPTEFWVYIWRLAGTTWSLVGREEISASLVPGQINTVALATPIAAMTGDYVGYGGTGDGDPLASSDTGAANSVRYADMAAPTGGVDWSAQTGAAWVVPVVPLMRAPAIVCIGDSITTGTPGNRSFIDAPYATDPASEYRAYVAAATGQPMQNMGIGGNTAAMINNRVVADLIDLKPKVCVITCGINDAKVAGAVPGYLGTMRAMIDLCTGAGIVPVFLAVPWTNGTDVKRADLDTMYAGVRAILAEHELATFVDARPVVGQARPTGPAGNFWDIIPALTTDGSHYTTTGYAALAGAILDTRVGGDTTGPATATDPGWLIGDDAGDLTPAALATSDPFVETDINGDLMPKV